MKLTRDTWPDTPMFSREQVAQYQRDGYIVAKKIISPEVALRWKATLKARLVDDDHSDEASGVRVWMASDMDPVTAENVQAAPFVAALQQLIGPDVEFLSVKAVFKNQKTTFASPWHQDWFYWGGTNKISVWIALDDADADNGCLQMIPGSHKQVAEKKEIDDGQGFSYRLTDDQIADMPIETLPVQRGDAVFFHDLTLHASRPNISGRDRWCAISTYRSGAEKDESSVWSTSLVLSGSSVNV